VLKYVSEHSITSRSLGRLLVTIVVWLHMGFPDNAYAGQHWTPLDKVTTANFYRLCFLDSLTGWVAGDSGTILKTTNGGRNWLFQNAETRKNIVEVFFVDPHNGWALASVFPEPPLFEYGTIVLKTSDGGATWTHQWHPDNIYFTVFFFDTQRGWMAGELGRIVGTTNGGNDWFPANIDSSSVGSLAVRRLRFFSDSLGFGVGGRVELIGVVWRTTNGGARWTPQLAGSDPILDIHFFDSLNILGISGGFDDGTSMIRTSNGGETWEYTYIGYWGEPRAVSFRTATEGYSPLGFAGTIMKTTDAGRTWTEFHTPETTAMYDVRLLDSLTGYMVGEKGTILKYSDGPVYVGEDVPAGAPGFVYLHQNYPNPFNPSTTIRFRVPKPSKVTLTIYDLVGHEVTTLVHRQQNAGEFEAVWNGADRRGSQVAAGVYLAQLTVSPNWGEGSLVQVRKLVLLR
jgi:photosystem II stability/assembly factor-like uncharacterized protein